MFLLAVVALLWMGAVAQQLASVDVCVTRLVTGTELIDAHVAPGSTNGVLYLLRKAGLVVRFDRRNATNQALQTVVDFSTSVRNSGEMGALSLAFHPRFATNRLFYVLFIRNPDQNSVVTEFTMNAAGTSASSPRVVLDVPRSNFGNHKGGSLLFGADGKLYITLGDGGDSNDTPDMGQNKLGLLGKILRIDVDGRDAGKQYAVPADNPFVGDSSFAPEIFTIQVDP